eukprot:1888697-Pyramimonas_sp.AAC.1
MLTPTPAVCAHRQSFVLHLGWGPRVDDDFSSIMGCAKGVFNCAVLYIDCSEPSMISKLEDSTFLDNIATRIQSGAILGVLVTPPTSSWTAMVKFVGSHGSPVRPFEQMRGADL